MPYWVEILIITLAFTLVICLALFVSDIMVVFGLIGATVSNIIAYILPGAFFLKACVMNAEEGNKIENLSFYRKVSWFLVIFGFVVMVICITSKFV